MPWVTTDHPTKKELSACVQCGLCLPHCPTFRLTGLETASPRGRLMAMSAVAAGTASVDDDFAEMMGFCLQCRACEAVCPGLVPFGRAMEGARAEVAAQLPNAGSRLRHMILGRVIPNRPLMTLATVLAAAIKPLPILPKSIRRGLNGMRPMSGRRWSTANQDSGTPAPRGVIGLLTGCVMDLWFPRVHEATANLLRMAGYRVVAPRGQTCCGALAAHDGAAAVARRLASVNERAFSEVDVIVSDAAGCTAHLKEYRHWVPGGGSAWSRVRDITEVIAGLIEEGVLPKVALDHGPVAVQDPCHLRHAQRILAAPRTVLRAAGYRPVELDPDGLCCGAAGIYAVLRPQASAELGMAKADQVRLSGCVTVASANPGCEMQLRAHLGGGFRIAHPVELYWESVTSRP
jgi:glycolate oxidase iron-sulfur subunit